MKSWQSKVSLLLILSASSAGLSSCKLFGGGEYSSQMEVETEVPESLEHGKASSGPKAEKSGSYASTASSVPLDSNLMDLPGLPGDSSTLPTVGSSSASPGGASMAGMPAGGFDRIDIPKPDFGSVDLNTPTRRAPAEAMVKIEPSSPRMALPNHNPSLTYKPVKEEQLEPLSSPTPTAEELAKAPAASAVEPENSPPAKPGIPLLLSSSRLSDYYQNLHSSLLDKSVVENAQPAGETPALDLGANPPPPAADELSEPPPPPSADEAAPPPPPPAAE